MASAYTSKNFGRSTHKYYDKQKDTVDESLRTICYRRDWNLEAYSTKYLKNPKSLQSIPGGNHTVLSVRRTLIFCVHLEKEKKATRGV